MVSKGRVKYKLVGKRIILLKMHFEKLQSIDNNIYSN